MRDATHVFGFFGHRSRNDICLSLSMRDATHGHCDWVGAPLYRH